MRDLAIGAAFFVALSGAAQAQSASFLAMEDRFEQRLRALEPDLDGLAQMEIYDRAAPIAESIYGADWRIVAAEARRTLRALPRFDLAPYAHAEARFPFVEHAEHMDEIVRRFAASPGQMAALRFYDARTLGSTLALMAIAALEDAPPSIERAYYGTMFANRVFRARLGEEDVLVTRTSSALVVIPYTLSAQGLFVPDFARVHIYHRR